MYRLKNVDQYKYVAYMCQNNAAAALHLVQDIMCHKEDKMKLYHVKVYF